ncbi:MAG TPA: sugar phosphate nucleotidyltransferase [Candidatus Thermoplasmatota archaeon]|nr:sugar phosphate nucleotidyltransferase [Candidatus Thermoplasmatota archaeon]
MQVVILAAGRGMRLRPLTHDRPKSMLNAAGRPMIHHLLENLATLGVKQAVLVVGHGHDRVRAYVGDGTAFGVRIDYVHQERQLGPGHALAEAAGLLKDEWVLLLPADAWYHPELLGRLAASKTPGLVQVPDLRSARHGTPVLRQGHVVDMLEHQGEATIASGGAYLLHRRLLESLESVDYSLRDAIRADLHTHGPWNAIHAHPGEYIDVIELQDLLELHSRLMSNLKDDREGTIEPGASVVGPVELGPGSIVRAGSVLHGPVHVGANCEIGPHAVLLPGTAVRNHVRVEPFTLLSKCAISSNVTIGSHSRIENAVLDNGASVGPGARLEGGLGLIVGADARLESGCSMGAESRVGRGAKVAAGRTVHIVPDGGVAV